jgi:hypothetical protein
VVETPTQSNGSDNGSPFTDQIVLAARDTPDGNYRMATGSVLSWPDSLCVQMVGGHGPLVAPRTADVPAYAAITGRSHYQAYVAVPLLQPNGELFGTLWV